MTKNNSTRLVLDTGRHTCFLCMIANALVLLVCRFACRRLAAKYRIEDLDFKAQLILVDSSRLYIAASTNQTPIRLR